MVNIHGLHLLTSPCNAKKSDEPVHITSAEPSLLCGAFVLPIIHNITSVGMKTLCIEVQRNGGKSFITKNRMRAEVTAEFYVRVAPTNEAVSIAAKTRGRAKLGGKDDVRFERWLRLAFELRGFTRRACSSPRGGDRREAGLRLRSRAESSSDSEAAGPCELGHGCKPRGVVHACSFPVFAFFGAE